MAFLNSCTAGQNSGVSCSATTFAERSMIFCSESGGITVGCQTQIKDVLQSCLYPAIGCWYALPRLFQAFFFFIQKASDLCGQFDELIGVLLGHYLLAERSPAFTILALHKRSPPGRNTALIKVCHK